MTELRSMITSAFDENDIWILNSEISRSLYNKVSEELEGKKDRKSNAILYVVTYGGDPHAAFRIARAFKHYYENLKIIIPSFCKSAGTLIAIGADALAIGDMGELGPLDIQVTKSDEFIERVSGLEIKESLDSIYQHAHYVFTKALVDVKMGTRVSMKLAGEIATQFAIGVVNPLYSQIDPNRIGELSRAMKIAECYGRILNEKSKNLKDGALEKIISGYPSHAFVIDRKEASTLFSQLSGLNKVEKEIYNIFDFILLEPKNETCFLALDRDMVIKIYDKHNEKVEDDEQGSDNENDSNENEIEQSGGNKSGPDGKAPRGAKTTPKKESSGKPKSKENS